MILMESIYYIMSAEMFSFVLENLPNEWEKDVNYNESYKLFTVNDNTEEYRTVKELFTQHAIKSIVRVQNPFQYGRFKLRQEMCETYYVDTVYCIVHTDDLSIALKYTCDYRRYNKTAYGPNLNKQPKFYNSVSSAITNNFIDLENAKVLVLYKISGNTLTQSDYYVQYVVSLSSF
ncbi:Hypothetical protein CINCED_3A023718 [Cinara cedri]|uniref:Uncharacterized protein n=1 Tax=Cinara cedri TaxID=506608 RepID=A0A5E4M2L1_9HEMI|nr:Hypothetical protein CINCED_3A023718 [Cinara cedri]